MESLIEQAMALTMAEKLKLIEALWRSMPKPWKEEMDKKIDEAIDEAERGEITPHKKGDCGRMGREYLKEKRAREGIS
jgi:hypothetical protein